MTFSERIAAWMHQSLKSSSVESGALRPFKQQQQQQRLNIRNNRSLKLCFYGFPLIIIIKLCTGSTLLRVAMTFGSQSVCCVQLALTRHPLAERYGLAHTSIAAWRVDICYTGMSVATVPLVSRTDVTRM